jgi:hypothetical protein
MSEEFDPYYKWLGIRPEERPISHYRLLGLAAFEEDTELISNAADQRMSFLKTFQTGPHSRLSQDLLNELAKARLCLLHSQKKAHYDASLRAEMAVGAQLVPADGATPSTADNSTRKYYCARGEQTFGPFSSDEMRQFACEGSLLSDDLVMKVGHGGWVPARDLPGLASFFEAAPENVAEAPTLHIATPPEQSRAEQSRAERGPSRRADAGDRDSHSSASTR